jgi:hypothetical protein
VASDEQTAGYRYGEGGFSRKTSFRMKGLLGNLDGVRAEPPRIPALSSYGITRLFRSAPGLGRWHHTDLRVSPLGKRVGKEEWEVEHG